MVRPTDQETTVTDSSYGSPEGEARPAGPVREQQGRSGAERVRGPPGGEWEESLSCGFCRKEWVRQEEQAKQV